jgi:tRNA(adenine34) deaminase
MNYKLFSDEYFMNEALKEAKIAFEKDEVPIGAVVVCDRTIIAKAHNLTELLTDVTAHAEMQAITAASDYLASKFLEDCTLYVTVEPCMMCAGALYWSRIGKVVYGTKDKKKGYSNFSPILLHPKTNVVNGILETEAAKLMTDFFKMKR